MTDLDSIDEACQYMFTQRGISMDAIPSTKAALVQHTKRVIYQASYCWRQALDIHPDRPSPGECGLTNPAEWRPLWTTLPESSTSARMTAHIKLLTMIFAQFTSMCYT